MVGGSMETSASDQSLSSPHGIEPRGASSLEHRLRPGSLRSTISSDHVLKVLFCANSTGLAARTRHYSEIAPPTERVETWNRTSGHKENSKRGVAGNTATTKIILPKVSSRCPNCLESQWPAKAPGADSNKRTALGLPLSTGSQCVRNPVTTAKAKHRK